MDSLQKRLGGSSIWVALLVASHGIIIIADTLIRQFNIRELPHRLPVFDLVIDLPLLLGLALLYVSLLLARRKRNAWALAVGLYVFIVGLNTNSVLGNLRSGTSVGGGMHFLELLLPLLMLGILWMARKEFVVRSDFRTFASSLRMTAIVLAVAFLYGTFGYMLMDKADFRQEITPIDAMHYTVDQFDLTTNPLHAYSRRAKLFQASLTFISISAVGFAFVSFFQPLRARYAHLKEHADQAHKLVYEYKADSEDYFKLWPADKTYLFAQSDTACVAYRVYGGVALAVGDPLSATTRGATAIMSAYEEMCFVNDWRPVLVHVTPHWKERLSRRGYQLQLIGTEAVVDVVHFENTVVGGKYFRQINNRFTKLGYTTEVLQPPHHEAVIDRLRHISQDWLGQPGRVERGFMMGYFNESYMQQCALFVARDAAGTIQAFLNLLPSPIPEEANYDLLRSADSAPGNINDYLLIQLFAHLASQGISRLNMGLCPLAGLDEEPNTLINRSLRFVYANGDRLYSFRGLYRFKAKYEPKWSERYVAYKGGVTDFTRAMSALGQAMKVK